MTHFLARCRRGWQAYQQWRSVLGLGLFCWRFFYDSLVFCGSDGYHMKASFGPWTTSCQLLCHSPWFQFWLFPVLCWKRLLFWFESSRLCVCSHLDWLPWLVSHVPSSLCIIPSLFISSLLHLVCQTFMTFSLCWFPCVHWTSHWLFGLHMDLFACFGQLARFWPLPATSSEFVHSLLFELNNWTASTQPRESASGFNSPSSLFLHECYVSNISRRSLLSSSTFFWIIVLIKHRSS